MPPGDQSILKPQRWDIMAKLQEKAEFIRAGEHGKARMGFSSRQCLGPRELVREEG